MALRLPPSHVLSERPRGPFHYRFPHKGEESGEMYSPDEQGEYGTATAASSFTIQGLSDALMALDPEVKPRWNAGRGAQLQINWDKEGNTHLNVHSEAGRHLATPVSVMVIICMSTEMLSVQTWEKKWGRSMAACGIPESMWWVWFRCSVANQHWEWNGGCVNETMCNLWCHWNGGNPLETPHEYISRVGQRPGHLICYLMCPLHMHLF